MTPTSDNGCGSFTPGGVGAPHTAETDSRIGVTPTLTDRHNTIKVRIRPIACWRLDDVRFDFDSSFIKPEAAAEFTTLASLWHEHGNAPLTIFGHADPTGDDVYNKTLSGRRALAVYGLLVRDTEIWEKLHSEPFGGDKWGARGIQYMLATLGYDPGIVDGQAGPKTSRAVRDFQTANDLAVDGKAGPKTRKVLFELYADAICRQSPDQPFRLTKEAFLSKGQNANGKGDYQGCGEHNPILVFSKDDNKEFAKASRKQERDALNVTNRRVLVFMFPLGTGLDQLRWPCPTVTAGPGGCQSQFWPDAAPRRSPSEKRRLYAASHDTFACRFYDGMSRRSPCEAPRSTLLLRLLDSENRAIPNAVYRVTSFGEVREGSANAEGWLVEQNLPAPSMCKVEFGYPPSDGLTSEERAKQWTQPGPYGYEIEVDLSNLSSKSDEEKARIRLANMGYPPELPLGDNLYAFQLAYAVYPADGTLNDATKVALEKVNSECLSKDDYEQAAAQS